MPFINIKVAGKLTKEQKQEIVKEFTDSLSKITGKSNESIYILIEEHDREDWGVGGNLLG